MLIKILAYVVMFSLLALCGYTFYLLRRMHKHIEESEKTCGVQKPQKA